MEDKSTKYKKSYPFSFSLNIKGFEPNLFDAAPKIIKIGLKNQSRWQSVAASHQLFVFHHRFALAAASQRAELAMFDRHIFICNSLYNKFIQRSQFQEKGSYFCFLETSFANQGWRANAQAHIPRGRTHNSYHTYKNGKDLFYVILKETFSIKWVTSENSLILKTKSTLNIQGNC